ncbi:MAG: VIT1/CCC1 transporter family protein [Candidatus Anstonellaceae archaeon]
MKEKEIERIFLEIQRDEITSHLLYKKLSEITKGKNSKIMLQISKHELKHYRIFENYTKRKTSPNRFKILLYLLLSKFLGLTFAIKLMEKEEENAQESYKKILYKEPVIKKILKQEEEHEKKLIEMIKEEKLQYIGSIILGLNDALVELTGAMAGFSIALKDIRLIGIAGLITGIAASLSMMSSEYLSKKIEGKMKKPFKAAIYTGFTYILTVLLLVFPFFIFEEKTNALLMMLVNATIITAFINYFVSIVKEISFKQRFFEMLLISFGVAAISFLFGFLLNRLVGI